MNATALSAYKSIGVESSIEGASDHQLVLLLLRGVLDRIVVARGAMDRDDVPGRGQAISEAIAIVDGLRASIDLDQGDIANNLASLYDFVEQHLLSANLQEDKNMLSESFTILEQILEAWEGIGNHVQ
ncbi:MAG: flagellar export chaperone FliS [Pseudomonadota bacterium]